MINDARTASKSRTVFFVCSYLRFSSPPPFLELSISSDVKPLAVFTDRRGDRGLLARHFRRSPKRHYGRFAEASTIFAAYAF